MISIGLRGFVGVLTNGFGNFIHSFEITEYIPLDKHIDLTSSTDAEEFQFRARELNENFQTQYNPDGTIKYLEGSYKTALAAALAENKIIEANDGEATMTQTGKDKFTIEEMCNAIYRNDQSAREFITNIDEAIDNVSLRVTEIGAYMNRLDSTLAATDVQRENLTQSISTLKDADVAKESSDYIKWQILQQSTATLLSTANQQPQIALNLL